MSKNNSNFGEVIRKYWFYGLIGIIFIIFLFDNVLAIWLTVIFLIIFLIIYLPSLSFTGKLIRYMKKQNVVEDKLVAQKFKRPLDEIKKKMDQLSTKKKGKKWLIASLNNRYVFYNKNTIDKFKDLYYMGFNEKRIFDTLRKNAKIRTRAEINTIKTILISQNKLSESKISPIEVVQQPQKIRGKSQPSQQKKSGKAQEPQEKKGGKSQPSQQIKRGKPKPSQQKKNQKAQEP